jgi:hypothetical protein
MSQVIPEVGAPSYPWTGPVHLDMLNAQGQAAGIAEMYVSVDTVTVRFGGRTLAFIVRDFFRSWLQRPGRPYVIDDIIWSVQGDALCMTVNDQFFYSPPGEVIGVLRRLM